MERTIKDLMTRVQGLLGRVEQRSTEATVTELRAIHIALDGILRAVRGDDPRRILDAFEMRHCRSRPGTLAAGSGQCRLRAWEYHARP